MSSPYVRQVSSSSRTVRFLQLSTALTGFSIAGVRAVLFNLYMLRMGYGPQSIGGVNAVTGLTFWLFSLPVSTLASRWSMRRALITAVALMAAGLGLLPLTDSLPPTWRTGWLLWTTALVNLGQTAYFVNITPFLMSASAPAERHRVFSVQVAVSPLAAFVGSLVAGVLPEVSATLLGVSAADPSAYRYPLLLAAVVLLPAVPALMATREVPAAQAEGSAGQGGRPPYGLIAGIALTVLLRLAGRSAATTFFNVYLDEHLHASTALIGALAAAGQLLSVPAALLSPLVASRWGNVRTIVWGSLGMALGMLPLALIPHPAAAGLAFVAVAALFSITTGPLRIYSQEIVSPPWRTAMSGGAMAALGVSISLTSLGGGYAIAALGYRALFLAAAGLTALGALLFWAFFRRVG